MRIRRMMGLSALALAAACGPETMKEPPPDITGRWFTDDPEYADRAFEISERFLYLLVGVDSFVVHRIDRVVIAEAELPLYTIEYEADEGAVLNFHFFLSQEDGGTILFRNQTHMKWRRDPRGPVPWSGLVEGGS